MRHVSVLFVLLINLALSASSQSGADCANAIPLTLDGVTRTYAVSSSLGNPITCTSYNSNTPVTYVSFTTNASAERIRIMITGPTADPLEVILYEMNCSFSYGSSSMCFADGTGIWSFSHGFSIPASTTFKLRIKTYTTGNITINANYYTPPNNLCSGATGISATPLQDHNACNLPGSGVVPGDLCAASLENTAFYKYVVENTGVSIVNINNISCDNGASNNSNGFQIGFFTGSCGTLTPISCYTGSGSFVSATTVSLSAGTEVFVAIDGVAGSNCTYEISVINGNVLASEIKEFTGWQQDKNNMLKWTTMKESPGNIYEVQRSENGRNFVTIGSITAATASSKESVYQFEDKLPGLVSYYRIRNIEVNGQSFFSKVVELRRTRPKGFTVSMVNPVRNVLNMQILSDENARLQFTLINGMGQIMMNEKLNCIRGVNPFSKSVSALPAGNYHLFISGDKEQTVTTLVKLN